MDIQSWAARNLLYHPAAAIQAGPVRAHLAELERRQFESPEDRRARQIEALRRLILHARAHVPHYARSLAALGPEEPRSLDDVRRLPFLTKQDLQERAGELRSRGPVGRLIAKTTGGSTGQPVTVWKTRDAWAKELAATWRGYGWAGVRVGDRQARFWGIPYQTGARRRARLIDAVCNRVRFSAFRFSEADMRDYLEIIERRRPRYFYGYASMLQEFAEFMRRAGRSLSHPPLCVITTSEVLTRPVRQLLEQVFAAPVYDEYGCGELGTIAHECPDHRMHLSEENMIVEILDGDRPCADGEPGEIVVTELNNTAMPLLRYRTGDFGTSLAEDCPCGRTLRALVNIHGRAYDFVRGSGGKLFHPEFVMYVFEEIRRAGPGIRQFQVRQETPDRFRIRIVREEGYGPHTEALIERRFREHVHAQAEMIFEYVSGIEREASGKLRLIVGLKEDPAVDLPGTGDPA
ncbi:MAG: AMP-binding protein [Candidatus Eisenbacteria bacterium]